jgi:hypothetical protein
LNPFRRRIAWLSGALGITRSDRTLGIKVPPSIPLRADQAIEKA